MLPIGREDAKDEDHFGHPSTSHSDQNVKKMGGTLNSDQRLSFGTLVDDCNIHKSTVHHVVTEDLRDQQHLTSSWQQCIVTCRLYYHIVLGETRYGNTGQAAVPGWRKA